MSRSYPGATPTEALAGGGWPRSYAAPRSIESAALELARCARSLRALARQARAGTTVGNNLARRISAYEEALRCACREQERLRRVRSTERASAGRVRGKLADELSSRVSATPSQQPGPSIGLPREEE
jgi:hypothetical protein